jgi:hypothetical protein
MKLYVLQSTDSMAEEAELATYSAESRGDGIVVND